MAEARTFTASHETMRQACEAALASEIGVTVQFPIYKHGTLEACYARARSFQQVFTTFRARTRKMAAAGSDPMNDLVQPRGRYDDLACQRDLMPGNAGWSVSIIPGRLLLDSLDIIDNATGKPLSDIGSAKDERETLLSKLFDKQRLFTITDATRLMAIDEFLREQVGGDLNAMLTRYAEYNVEQIQPSITPQEKLAKLGGKAVVEDLADLDLDINPFTGEKDVDDEE